MIVLLGGWVAGWKGLGTPGGESEEAMGGEACSGAGWASARIGRMQIFGKRGVKGLVSSWYVRGIQFSKLIRKTAGQSFP